MTTSTLAILRRNLAEMPVLKRLIIMDFDYYEEYLRFMSNKILL